MVGGVNPDLWLWKSWCDARTVASVRVGKPFFLPMDNTTFGLTMLIVGMGGTLLTLWILTGVIHLLVRFFPPEHPPKHPKA